MELDAQNMTIKKNDVNEKLRIQGDYEAHPKNFERNRISIFTQEEIIFN